MLKVRAVGAFGYEVGEGFLSTRAIGCLRSTAVLFAAVLGLIVLIAGARAQEAPTAVAHVPTTTRLSASAVGADGRAVFSIEVEGGDRGIPTGVVSLSDGRSSLGSVLLDENGSATYAAAVGAGAQHITAIYEGDGGFGPSSSLAVDVPAQSGVPTFTLSGTPTTLSVVAGNYVVTTVTVTPANGFDGTVQLSCSGLPPNSTCSFNPVNVVPGGTAPNTTAATSILTIQTSAPTGTGAAGWPNRSGGPVYAVLIPGFAALAGLGLWRRRSGGGMVSFLAIGLLLVACGLGLTACNPRYNYFAHPPTNGPGTTLGTSTVLVSGSSASAGAVIIPTPVSLVLTVTAAQ